jgi:hypothetical protein
MRRNCCVCVSEWRAAHWPANCWQFSLSIGRSLITMRSSCYASHAHVRTRIVCLSISYGMPARPALSFHDSFRTGFQLRVRVCFAKNKSELLAQKARST